ncbi:MAG: hypothetical protein TE42_01595 [Candidatus Synechococcus spongiarum SP3]|uniref:Uncharacterized protein n=1 Tax=Candidatus Synechococcus spongiarum SP3 TaxID=1604020 RepID=A0A0G2HMJ6_9SYNE|nr:MAG: hypothetical protein TE42_01595 [Candidatus Synechococcus spongiarum SP3]
MVLEFFDAPVVKATALFADHHLADAQSLGNFHLGPSFGTDQKDLGTTDQAVPQHKGAGHRLQIALSLPL